MVHSKFAAANDAPRNRVAMPANGSVPFSIWAAQLRPSITSPPKTSVAAGFAGGTRNKSKQFFLRALRSSPRVSISGVPPSWCATRSFPSRMPTGCRSSITAATCVPRWMIVPRSKSAALIFAVPGAPDRAINSRSSRSRFGSDHGTRWPCRRNA